MKILTLFTSILLTFSLQQAAFAQTEADLDKKFLSSDNNTEKIGSGTIRNPAWDHFGFIENNNHLGISPDHPQGTHTAKLEGRGSVTMKYGIDNLYAKTSLNIFFYPGNRNDELPHENQAIEAREVYLQAELSGLQIKLGKQLFQWGTGDVFQVTNYLDQPDLREFAATDKDDRYSGVFALSLKLLIRDFSLEGCVSPVHTPPLLPDGFWSLTPSPIDSPGGPLTVAISEPQELDSSFSNVSYAVRAGATLGDLDLHITYFNGINNNLVFNTVLTKDSAGSNPYMNMQPYFERISAIGLDLAYVIDQFTIRAEGSYTFDMPVQSKASTSELLNTFLAATAGSAGDFTITEMETTTAISYVLGADYLAWGNNGRIYLEWLQVWYPESGDYNETLFSKQFHIRLEDKWYNEYITTKIATTGRIDGDIGYVVNGELGWDFKTGMTMLVGCYIFTGNDDELYELVKDKDVIYTRLRMEF